MHIRPTQLNPNVQMDALYAAEKAAAKRDAEQTRKKLMEFASKMAAEAESGEACIVELGAREESQEESDSQEQEKPRTRRKHKEEVSLEEAASSISDWA